MVIIAGIFDQIILPDFLTFYWLHDVFEIDTGGHNTLNGDLNTFLLAAAIIFVSCLILGITSFGSAMFAVPLLSLLFPLKTLVPLMIIYGGIIEIILLLPLYKDVQLKNMSYLVIAGLLGTPLGTYLLLVIDEGILKIVIGIIVIIFALATYTHHSFNIKNEKLGNIVAGFLSGLLNGSITMSGPPVILFYSNNHLEKQVFRANLAFYFVLLNVVTVPVLFLGGLMTPQVIHYTLVGSPALALGAAAVLIGNKVGNRINNALFTKITLILVVMMGLLSIYSGL